MDPTFFELLAADHFPIFIQPLFELFISQAFPRPTKIYKYRTEIYVFLRLLVDNYFLKYHTSTFALDHFNLQYRSLRKHNTRGENDPNGQNGSNKVRKRVSFNTILASLPTNTLTRYQRYMTLFLTVILPYLNNRLHSYSLSLTHLLDDDDNDIDNNNNQNDSISTTLSNFLTTTPQALISFNQCWDTIYPTWDGYLATNEGDLYPFTLQNGQNVTTQGLSNVQNGPNGHKGSNNDNNTLSPKLTPTHPALNSNNIIPHPTLINTRNVSQQYLNNLVQSGVGNGINVHHNNRFGTNSSQNVQNMSQNGGQNVQSIFEGPPNGLDLTQPTAQLSIGTRPVGHDMYQTFVCGPDDVDQRDLINRHPRIQVLVDQNPLFRNDAEKNDQNGHNVEKDQNDQNDNKNEHYDKEYSTPPTLTSITSITTTTTATTTTPLGIPHPALQPPMNPLGGSFYTTGTGGYPKIPKTLWGHFKNVSSKGLDVLYLFSIKLLSFFLTSSDYDVDCSRGVSVWFDAVRSFLVHLKKLNITLKTFLQLNLPSIKCLLGQYALFLYPWLVSSVSAVSFVNKLGFLLQYTTSWNWFLTFFSDIEYARFDPNEEKLKKEIIKAKKIKSSREKEQYKKKHGMNPVQQHHHQQQQQQQHSLQPHTRERSYVVTDLDRTRPASVLTLNNDINSLNQQHGLVGEIITGPGSSTINDLINLDANNTFNPFRPNSSAPYSFFPTMPQSSPHPSAPGPSLRKYSFLTMVVIGITKVVRKALGMVFFGTKRITNCLASNVKTIVILLLISRQFIDILSAQSEAQQQRVFEQITSSFAGGANNSPNTNNNSNNNLYFGSFFGSLFSSLSFLSSPTPSPTNPTIPIIDPSQVDFGQLEAESIGVISGLLFGNSPMTAVPLLSHFASNNGDNGLNNVHGQKTGVFVPPTHIVSVGVQSEEDGDQEKDDDDEEKKKKDIGDQDEDDENKKNKKGTSQDLGNYDSCDDETVGNARSDDKTTGPRLFARTPLQTPEQNKNHHNDHNDGGNPKNKTKFDQNDTKKIYKTKQKPKSSSIKTSCRELHNDNDDTNHQNNPNDPNTKNNDKSRKSHQVPELPPIIKLQSPHKCASIPSDFNICQWCLSSPPSAIGATNSGYCCCYQCLLIFVGKYQKCPFTHTPMSVDDIRSVWIAK